MSIYLMIDIAIASLYVLLAYFAIINKESRTKQGFIFVVLTLAFLVWVLTNHISNDVSVPYDIAIVATRVLFSASFIATVFALALVSEISGHKTKIFNPMVILAVTFVAILLATPLIVGSIYEDGSVYGIAFGPLGVIYGITVSVLVSAMLIIIGKNWNDSNPVIRRQIRAVGLGAIITAPLILLIAYIIPAITGSFEISQIAITPSIILVTAIYYATIRHGLFDLRAVAVRTMTYILTLSVLTAIYFLLAYILSIILFQGRASSQGLSISPLNVLLALVMAIMFQPIKQLFDKLTNDIFYRGAYNQEEFLKEFSRILSYNTNTNLLIERASEYIADNLKSSSVTFFIKGRDLGRKNDSLSLRLSSKMLDEITENMPKKNKDDILIVDHLESERLRKILSHHKIKIVLPMRLNNETVGYLFLGEHKNDNYSTRDIRVLESISSELVIAISNSLSVEVIRDLNENLQQKVDYATRELRKSNEKLKELDKTKDEFLSIASHQLRTPLTSIKGYVDMLRDGDFGDVNEAQKNALDETFSSSERMVRLINDFLNVSRLQTGKFTIEKRPTNFSDLVQQEVNMLNLVAGQSDIKINAKIDKIEDIKLDVEKVQQVVVNMIDNAIYYSKPNSTIEVRLKKTKDFAEFTVKDTGIGVPKEDQEKLFGKFFRAPNARKRRPDGTGVGLFLSKKVVTGHNGEVIFKSEEGRGSTFGFRLPYKTLGVLR